MVLTTCPSGKDKSEEINTFFSDCKVTQGALPRRGFSDMLFRAGGLKKSV